MQTKIPWRREIWAQLDPRAVASGIDDWVLEDSRFPDLSAFYEEQVSPGCWHPRLAQAMADFTAVRDTAAAILLYQLALDPSRALDEDTHATLIALAESLIESGRKEQAEVYPREGRGGHSRGETMIA